MIPLLRTVASALAAVLLGWLLPASAGAAVDVPLVAYTYDALHIQAAPAHDRVERAPPTTQAVLPLHLASDRGWSVAFAWPETIYNTRNSSYDQSVLLVPTDSSAAGGEATLSGAPEMVPGMGWERAYSIRATGVAAKSSSAGWKVGKPINTLTKAGNSPAWSTVRARYWKNGATKALDGEYSPANLTRMGRGRAPLHDEVGVSKELNHRVPRHQGGGHSFNNLEEVWPWEHAAIDRFRFYKGPVPK